MKKFTNVPIKDIKQIGHQVELILHDSTRIVFGEIPAMDLAEGFNIGPNDFVAWFKGHLKTHKVTIIVE